MKESTALDRHTAIAESIRPLALVLFLAALGIMLLDRRARSAWPFHARPPVNAAKAPKVALATFTVVLALVTCVRLYQIGESGAKATWEGTRIVATSARRAS